MIVIVCIDDEFGMLFNQRRQSRDCILTEDILKTVGDKRLLIDKFSKTLFLHDSAHGDGTAQTDGSFSGDGMPLCESVIHITRNTDNSDLILVLILRTPLSLFSHVNCL